MPHKIPSFKDRVAWWQQSRFGMFIHYGLYSIIGRHEWVMNRERIPRQDYEQLTEQFTAEHFTPAYYTAQAKDAGMKYMVLTAKHHEGFCLWDTKTTRYNAMNTPAGRDLVGEYTEAARSAGMGVGLYFSLMDWYHPDGHKCLHDERARKRFVAYVHAQVEELMTNYGKIDILWYDVPWPLKPDGWDSIGLNYMVRSLQPDILINNRSISAEDFTTPEQKVSAAAPYRSWETCMTMNGSWGYNWADNEWKPVKDLLAVLVKSVSGGGNLVLNVGPKGDGTVPEESIHILKEMGSWLKRNGDAIYGTDRVPVEWMNCGMATVKGSTMYWHITRWYGKELWIGGIRSPIRNAYILGTGRQIPFKQTFKPQERLFLYDLPEESPDQYIPVIALECEETPEHRLGAGIEWVDGVLPLAGEMGI